MLERNVWIPCDVALSCCAIDCAAWAAEICVDALPDVVDSDCSAVVRFENAFSSEPAAPGVPYTDCNWVSTLAIWSA